MELSQCSEVCLSLLSQVAHCQESTPFSMTTRLQRNGNFVCIQLVLWTISGCHWQTWQNWNILSLVQNDQWNWCLFKRLKRTIMKSSIYVRSDQMNWMWIKYQWEQYPQTAFKHGYKIVVSWGGGWWLRYISIRKQWRRGRLTFIEWSFEL